MTSLDDENPVDGLGHFFDTVWGDVEGYVYLPTRDIKSNSWQKVFYEWPKHKHHVVNHVLASTAKGVDVYFAPALFAAPKPVKENVKGTSILWTDFDGNAPEKWSPVDSEAASGAHAQPVPPPSLRLQSSSDGHEHVYWKLDEFTTDIEWVESSNRSIAYTMRADTSGWDANQILRPPFTTNYKHDLPVTIISDDTDKPYSRSSFAALKPTLVLVSDSIDVDNVPEVEAVVAKYAWDEEHFKMFMDPQIPEGKRSSALMRLGYYCAEKGMSDEEAYSILANADSRWGKFKNRNDRKKRLLDIINRARQKHPVGLDNLTFNGLISDKSEVAQNIQYVYGLEDFLQSELEIEWAVEGLLEKGGYGMVASAPGIGKTQLTIQFAIACALGTNFLGFPVVKKNKVAFFSLEMSHVALKLFLNTIIQHYSDADRLILQKNLMILPIGEAVPVDRPEGKKFIETMLDEIEPDMVVIDSLGKLVSKDISEEMARALNNYYSHLRNKYGCSIWLIHHNRKPNGDMKKTNNLSDVYGSMYLTSDMTSVFTLWQDPEGKKDEIELQHVKNRLAERLEPTILVRDSHLHFTLKSEHEAEFLSNVDKNFSDKGESGVSYKSGNAGLNL